MRSISVRETVAGTYRLVSRNFVQILAITWLLLAAAALVQYLTLDAYFTLLASFLAAPNARTASLALGVATVGLLVWLFLYSKVAASLSNLLRGESRGVFGHLRLRRADLRVFAANLRFILLVAVSAIGVVALADALSIALGARFALAIIGLSVIVACAGAAWLVARAGFLIPIIAVAERGRVVRRSWSLTKDHGWHLLAIWAGVVVVPGILAQWLGEVLVRLIGLEAPNTLRSPFSLSGAGLAQVHAMLPSFVVTLTVSSAVCLVLSVCGAYCAYNALTSQD